MSYSQAFSQIRALLGNPTLRCIRPWSSQTPPTGYSYNATFDRHMNSGGSVWEPATSSLLYDDVAIVPGGGSATLELVPGGIVDTGDVYARILPASKTTVESAAFFTIDGYEYVLTECTAFPKNQPQWYTVRLRKR